GTMLGARTNAIVVIKDNEIPTLIDTSFDSGTGATDRSDKAVEISKIAALPDGKVLIDGDFSRFNGTDRNSLTRLNTNGSVDDGFSARLNFNKAETWLQPDGRILYFYYPTLSRLDTSGALDSSFQKVSFRPTPPNSTGENNFAIAIQADARIVV